MPQGILRNRDRGAGGGTGFAQVAKVGPGRARRDFQELQMFLLLALGRHVGVVQRRGGPHRPLLLRLLEAVGVGRGGYNPYCFMRPNSGNQFFSCQQTFLEVQLPFKLHFYTKKIYKKRNWSSRNVCGRLNY